MKITPKLSDMPKNPSTAISPMENAICKMIDLESEIRELNRVLEIKKAEAVTYIFEIQNDEYQTLLMLRYLRLMSWEMISCEMHYSKRWLYKMHGTALKYLTEILKMISKITEKN